MNCNYKKKNVRSEDFLIQKIAVFKNAKKKEGTEIT